MDQKKDVIKGHAVAGNWDNSVFINTQRRCFQQHVMLNLLCLGYLSRCLGKRTRKFSYFKIGIVIWIHFTDKGKVYCWYINIKGQDCAIKCIYLYRTFNVLQQAHPAVYHLNPSFWFFYKKHNKKTILSLEKFR